MTTMNWQRFWNGLLEEEFHEDQRYAQDVLANAFTVFCAILGMLSGFEIGGIGGSIVFALVGAVVGFFLGGLIQPLIRLAVLFAVLGGIFGIVFLVISMLWGVGK